MDLVLYVSSMDMWLGTAQILSQPSQIIEVGKISEEGMAEEIMERDTKTRKEVK